MSIVEGQREAGDTRGLILIASFWSVNVNCRGPERSLKHRDDISFF